MKIPTDSTCIAVRLADELERRHPVEASHIAQLNFAFSTDPAGSVFSGFMHDQGGRFHVFVESGIGFDGAAAAVARRVRQLLSLRGDILKARVVSRQARILAGV